MDVSIIIGFRDWGLDRLAMCIRSMYAAIGEHSGEVVVSDYGSNDARSVEELCTREGAVYVYTESAVWARSRALNAGIAVSKGALLIFTDADMVVSPTTVTEVIGAVRRRPNAVSLLQCRDLPAGIAVADVVNARYTWRTLDERSRLRPRWGMGGFVAATREAFEIVRGLDERMQTYGGEDIDLINRMRRAGMPVNWIEAPEARLFHVWHPSSKTAAVDAGAEADVNANRKIVYEDTSVVRNVGAWHGPSPLSAPSVSFVIATHGRPEMLRDAVASALYQTTADIEVIVVSDGPSSANREVVEGLSALIEARAGTSLRYFEAPADSRVAAVRNIGTELAAGRYIAVLDDDDIVPPWRISVQLESLREGDLGSFGSFMNFECGSRSLATIHSKHFTAATAHDSGGAPGHGTWTVRTDVLKSIRYDERLRAGVDNDVALRMLRSGVKLRHAADLVLLRRLHPDQISSISTDSQRQTALGAKAFFDFSISDWASRKLAEEKSNSYPQPRTERRYPRDVLAFLPDFGFERVVVVPQGSADVRAAGTLQFRGHNYAILRDVGWDTLLRLRVSGTSHWLLPVPAGASDESVMFEVSYHLKGEPSVLAIEDERSTAAGKADPARFDFGGRRKNLVLSEPARSTPIANSVRRGGRIILRDGFGDSVRLLTGQSGGH
ncbi:glycosyltransferase [Cellulosimicrobium sp. SJTW-1]|uniref:glycosyltransferase n=1 Tax=Cellulosimicrobium sp. SJTW-1 TaxID=3078082 RepID=UPI0039EBF693